MATSSIDEKIDVLAKDLQSLVSDVSKDESARKKLLGVVLQGLATVEAPIETIWRMIMSVSTGFFLLILMLLLILILL